ncbi:hypothetical protein P3L10_013712 [Capsicum annuum]
MRGSDDYGLFLLLCSRARGVLGDLKGCAMLTPFRREGVFHAFSMGFTWIWSFLSIVRQYSRF